MVKEYKIRISHKIDTEQNWILNNPILYAGEIAFTIDGEHRNWFKLGDGTKHWSELTYAYSEFLASILNVDNITIEKNENGNITLKDTGVVAGTYGNNEDESEFISVPSITVNSKGQLTDIHDKRVQIKHTMNVIPVNGEYTISSNYSLIVGKSTQSVNCIVNVPSMPIGTQVVIKNVASNYSLIVRTKNVTIDGYSGDIVLAPYEYITIVATSSSEWSIIAESSRFDTTALSTLALNDDVVVRNDNTGNIEESLTNMSLNTNNIAQV